MFPEPFQGLAHLGLGKGPFLGIVPVSPVHGHLYRRFVPGNPSHPHAAGVITGMAHRGCTAGSDPLAAAVVSLCLLLQTVQKILEQFLRSSSLLKLFSSIPRASASRPSGPSTTPPAWPWPPRELEFFGVFQLRPFKMMRKHLVIQVKITFTLYQDGPGRGIEIIHGADQTFTQCLLKASRKEVGDLPECPLA